MSEEDKQNSKDLQPLAPDISGTEDLDAAGKSLSEAT